MAGDKTPVTVETQDKKALVSDLEPGSYLSRVSYMKVVMVIDEGIVVENQDGFQWTIGRNIVEAECFSADQFDPETVQKVSKTELVELLLSARDSAFTVAFRKQLNIDDAVDAMSDAIAQNGGLGAGKRNAKTFLKNTLPDHVAGELRVLQGHMIKPEPLLGRSKVWDARENSIRLVDHRTLQWLILRGRKYVLR